MKSKVRVIKKEDLTSKGVGLITDTEEVVSLNGLLITKEVKECLKTILEADAEYKRVKHTKKIEEGMRNKGVKRGRLPLAKGLQEAILLLREQGLTYSEIRNELEKENQQVSTKTINKYCKQKEVIENEVKN